MKTFIATLLVVGLTMAAPAQSATVKGPPDGTVTIEKTEFGLIIGGRSGTGQLEVGDKTHTFSISGFKLGTVGFSKVTASGEVYNLKDTSKFAGHYHGAEAGLTLAVGKGGLWMENEHGVILHLSADKVGAELNLGGGRVTIAMD